MGEDWNKCLLKYFEYALDESGTDVAECCRKVVGIRKVAGVIRSVVNARVLQFEDVA